MKITDYPISTDPKSDDVFVIEGEKGTQQLPFKTLKDFVTGKAYDNVVEHRKYRGKYLGSEYTSEQKQAISNGTFEDLYVGDYWTINNHDWRIMDVDYFYRPFKITENVIGSGNAHHLVVMPDDGLITSPAFNPDDSSHVNEWAKGYTSSNMYKIDNTVCKTMFENAFGPNSLVTLATQFPNGFDTTTLAVSSYEYRTDIKCMSPKLSHVYGGFATPYQNRNAQTSQNICDYFVGRFAAFEQNHNLIASSKTMVNSEDKIRIYYYSSDFPSALECVMVIGENVGIYPIWGNYANEMHRPFALIG